MRVLKSQAVVQHALCRQMAHANRLVQHHAGTILVLALLVAIILLDGMVQRVVASSLVASVYQLAVRRQPMLALRRELLFAGHELWRSPRAAPLHVVAWIDALPENYCQLFRPLLRQLNFIATSLARPPVRSDNIAT